MHYLVWLPPIGQILRFLAGLLLSFLFTTCHGQNKMYQPVPAERYFANNAALPVALACQHDDAEGIVQALQTTRVSPNTEGEQGMSLLLLAMSNRSKKAVESLLTHGADPNLITKLGRAQVLTQSVGLAAGGDDIEMLRLLLDHKGDPNSRFGSQGALSCAIDGERYDNMRLLLDRGANINATDNGGILGLPNESLVIRLAKNKKFEQVAYFIELGVDVNWHDAMGYTLAFTVQEEGFDYKPEDPIYPWVIKTKHLLEARGIHFPVASPLVARYAQERVENTQRRQWEATAEGRRWLSPIRAAEQERERSQNATQNYAHSQDLRLKAEEAFQTWRKSQPNWVPSVNYISRYYADPPPLAREEAEQAKFQLELRADSVRWAEQTKALH